MDGVFFGLTTFAEIRAQLGASDTEFDDPYMEDLSLDKELQLDLIGWFPQYQSLSDDEGTESSIVSQKLALKLYAKVLCAHKCIPSVRMRFLQKKAEGENQGVRFQHKDSINNLESDLAKKLADLKVVVLSFDTAHTPDTPVAEFSILGMSVSTPSTDIIVG